MTRQDTVIRVAGTGGGGIISLGDMLAQASARAGFFVHTFESYGPEVKGGASLYQLRVGAHPLPSPGHKVDILFVLDGESLPAHVEDLAPGAVVFSEAAPPAGIVSANWRHSQVPVGDILKAAGGGPRAKNMVALGVLGRLLGIPLPLLEQLVAQRYARKGESFLQLDLQALKGAWGYAQDLRYDLQQPAQARPQLLLSGNEAVALGALAARLDFFVGYPITPASDIMEFLALELPRFGGAMVQAEDEMAALAMALGASFAGKRAMTATSGPGLSLMVELMGLSGMAEVPVVLVDVQRAGPSTGLPTKPEQGDLDLALAGHGDSPRIVLAPTDVMSCFNLTVKAFALAERYQMPVLVLSDQFLAKRRESLPSADFAGAELSSRDQPHAGDGYQRYRVTETGVSPRSIPGEPGMSYVAESLEHTETGRPDYSPQGHRTMMAKRFRKLETAARELGEVRTYGSPEAEVGIIGWGSTFGAACEAVDLARERGLNVAACYPIALSPLPVSRLKEFASSVRKVIVPEMNFTGQLARRLRAEVGIQVSPLNIAEGRPIYAAEIMKAIEEVALVRAS